MKRQIIKIDENKCDGCGLCIPNCHEGALQLIEGKARLVSDLFCDGLGACIGHCPQGAIEIIEREAEPYDEIKVMEQMVKGPKSVIAAHLKHLKDHKAIEYFSQAVNFLKERNMEVPLQNNHHHHEHGGSCPGSKMISMTPKHENHSDEKGSRPSELGQWPVQLHLVSPAAPYFIDSELVIMSTCGPIANANVHQDYLRDRSVVVACPKLDYTEPYTEKLAAIFSEANIKKAIVVIMEVPCCKGLSKFAKDAAKLSGRQDLLVEEHIMGVNGEIKQKNILNGKPKYEPEIISN